MQINQTSGFVASQNNVSILINYIDFQVCTDEQEFGESSGSVQIIGSVIKDCKDVCTTGIPTYGLCLEDLQYGSIVDFQNVCLDPFEFVNHTCVCKYGYILNQSKCVNVVDSLINLDRQLLQNISTVNNTIDSNFAALDGLLASNYSQLQNQLNDTKQQLEINLQTLRNDQHVNIKFKASILEVMIFNNNTWANQLYNQLFTQLQQDCVANFTHISQNIDDFHTIAMNNLTNNISIINTTLKSQFISLDDLINQKLNQIQLYIDNSQLISNQNRISIMNQLDKYIYNNITKFNLFQAELQINLSNRIAQTANYIKQNYSQLINYIQGTYANYDYLKAKCNPGSVCGSTTNYQKRDASCPIHKRYTDIIEYHEDTGEYNYVCSTQYYTNTGNCRNMECTVSGWYDTSSCTVPSQFQYGGKCITGDTDCVDIVLYQIVTVVHIDRYIILLCDLYR
ncbi:Hypothetical_protein [Hexamita inflata]|uniref:Hypothetical_protein n=1 Tax=Hexamita inflata TaxID=28002 RepID=A0AA86QVT2_9EUKA|nr:Hypothetical protein HINF_LOCUS46105 [Hexamita inflata]